MNYAKYINLLTGVWAIKPSAGVSMAMIANRIFFDNTELSRSEQKSLIQQKIEKSCYKIIVTRPQAAPIVSSMINMKDAPKGSIAMIRITGTILKEGDICVKGLDDYERELVAAGENGNIAGVILSIDSGGGSIYGVERFGNLVKNFEKDYEKPITAFVSNEANSAAYWIASSAPRIFLDGQASEVGSVGAMVSFYDYTEYFNKEGIKSVIVNATKSVNKNRPYLDAIEKGDYSLLRRQLDQYNEIFLATVRKNRKGKLANSPRVAIESEDVKEKTVPQVLTGQVYIGQQAIDIGLADEISDLESVVDYITTRAMKEFGIDAEQTVVEHHEEEEDGYDNEFTINGKSNFTMYNKMSKAQLEARKDELQKQMTALTADGKGESDDYNATKYEVEQIDFVLSAKEATSQNKNLKAANASLSARVTELEKAVEDASNAQASEELQKQFDEYKASSEETVNALNEKLETSANELAEMKEQFEAVTTSKEELTAQLASKDTQIEESTQKMAAMEAFINANFEGGMDAINAPAAVSTTSDVEEVEQPKEMTKWDISRQARKEAAALLSKKNK
jgi:protease-4